MNGKSFQGPSGVLPIYRSDVFSREDLLGFEVGGDCRGNDEVLDLLWLPVGESSRFIPNRYLLLTAVVERRSVFGLVPCMFCT